MCWACARPAAMTRCWRMCLFRTGMSRGSCLLAGRESIPLYSPYSPGDYWALEMFITGSAKRALDQSITAAKSKGSLALSRSMAYHPEVQHAIADMVIELESIGPHLESDRRGLGPME